MAKSSFSRREFLKISALSSSAVALGACANLDQMFTGKGRKLENEVLILGAGAAGLSAAYALKKRKVPYRIFEASSRVGGRVQTVTLYPGEAPVAELGAEFFEESHSDVFQLAKEFNLATNKVKTEARLEAHLFSFDGKTYRVKDILPKVKTVQGALRRVRADLYRDQDVSLNHRNIKQFERSTYYDSLSLKDLLNSWAGEVDPVILKLIEIQAVTRFGVDADEQSSLHFLSTIDSEGSSLLTGGNTYRLEGGLSMLMLNMQERAAGVIPEQILKFNHELKELTEDKGIFELTFATPEGSQTYTTRNVICTIPFSKFRQVKGLSRMSFSEIKKEAIMIQPYATQSKGVLGFDTPFWRKKSGTTPANLGNFTGNFLTQKMWDSGRAQPGKQGLLTYQRSGASGLAAGGSAADEALKDLGLFYKDIEPQDVSESQLINWAQKPFALGSMAYFKKGQYMKYKGVALEGEYGGKFLFAGEHVSMANAGTLQGAIETGLQAAASIPL